MVVFSRFCTCNYGVGLKLLPFILPFSVDRNKYQIQIPLPPKIDPSVTMMTVEEKPDVTYNDVGGCKEQIEKMREVCRKNLFVLHLPLTNLNILPIIIFLRNSSFLLLCYFVFENVVGC